MSNLVQNSGFEFGLEHWISTNVTLSDEIPFEGTASARMGPGAASLYQDIKFPLFNMLVPQLFFNFSVQAPLSFQPGNLKVTLHWLDKDGSLIGTGLSKLMSSNTTGRQLNWLTYSYNIDVPILLKADKLRILFEKEIGVGPDDVLEIDEIGLATLSWRIS